MKWALSLVSVAVIVWVMFPTWLTAGESASTTLRNISLLLAAAIGLPLAIWRSAIAQRQAEAAHKQFDVAAQNLSNEQFKNGVEFLAHKSMPIRLGGVLLLGDTAEREPELYHIRVMQIFVAFLSYPPRYTTTEGKVTDQIDFKSADTLQIIKAINERTEQQKKIETQENFDLEQKLEGVPDVDARLSVRDGHQ